ncbi:uncharacterized protein LOC131054598 [Cryptomeria japonica]|uniref:uncharacterized protein LOC131054598 n=1 Tax=Cryptomeria japonica TaxID=3369 RepID=UPI0027DA0414|nr:uncharacterized protein LOC131054598 [Cryptomeria japonica]
MNGGLETIWKYKSSTQIAQDEEKFHTMNEGLECIVNPRQSTVKKEFDLPWSTSQNAHEDFSHIPMANYANPLSHQVLQFQSHLSVNTHFPLLPKLEPAIVEPHFQNPASLPISTNFSGNFSYQTPQIQSPFPATTNIPLLPQTSLPISKNLSGNSTYQIPLTQSPRPTATDLHLLPLTESISVKPNFQNPTSLPITINMHASSNWFHNENTAFQGNFDRAQLAYQASDGKYTQQIAYKEMQPYTIDMKASSFARRYHRSKIRRDCRSKEHHSYQVSEKKGSKYESEKIYSSIQASLQPANTEVETKTQISHGGKRLLLQKQLQTSDVSNLGRVVLPKKAAEANLPRLEMKEGIVISAKDHDNDRSWILKYK